jgi:putative FmdB family regulatory protein
MEVVQSFSDDSLTVCPECEGRLRKVFNAVGVVFKGSGFYRNDSRGAAPSESSGGSTGSESGSGSGKEKPAEKPAVATTAKGSGKSDAGTSSTPTPKSA